MMRRPATGENRGAITVSIMLATVMQALDTTIANVALPNMQGTFSASQDQISWVLTSYIVAAAIMTPATGFIVARFGRKRTLLVSVTGFTLASMLCGAATSIETMVLFRLLQGAFGAGLVPVSQAVLLDTYPRERHGSAMALWGIGVMVGPILGPTLGGWLTENYSWRWVFYINVPFGALALAGIWAFVPKTARDATLRLDWLGFALLALAIGSFQMMLDRGELKDWFSSTEIIAEAVLAALCLYLFLVHMWSSERPFLTPALFRDRNLVVGLAVIFLVGVVLLATLALLPPFLQGLLGYPVLTTGEVLAPRGIGTMIAMFLCGRAIGRIDARLIIALGLLLTAYSLHEMAGFTTEIGMNAILWTGLVQGAGLGFLFVPLSTLTFSTLESRHRTEAAAMYSLMRNLGSSVGISIVTALLAQNIQVNRAGLAEHITVFNVLQWLPNTFRLGSPYDPGGLAIIDAELTRQATMIAFLNDFRLMMYVVLCTLPLLLLLRGGGRQARMRELAPPE